MSKDGVEALRADGEALLAIAATLTPEEWALPSDCAGWTVQDVVAHLGTVFRSVVDPSSLPPNNEEDVERAADAWVAARRDWSPEQVVEDYVAMREQALVALESMQAPEMAEVVIPIANLGSYPLPMVANTLAFDHYTHIRVDLLKPLGPLDRTPPPSDELRLRPVLEWMLAGLQQMCAADLAWMDTPIDLTLGGPGGGTYNVAPGPVVHQGEAPTAAAAIHSTTENFVVWATKRRPWRDLGVRVEGDQPTAERFLDAIRIV